jgi:hypothetical protein
MANNRVLLILITASLWSVSSPTLAEEIFVADAEVIHTEPITKMHQQRSLAQECVTTKPRSTDLVVLLHWDLGTGNCASYKQEQLITGYRVFYRWDDHVFSQVMTQIPGERIPVRVRID